MAKGKSPNVAAQSPASPSQEVCVLVLQAWLEDFELVVHCQRVDGVDRVFSTDMEWLRAERPSESTLASSAEALLPAIIARCRHYVGEPVEVRGGVLSKETVESIISRVRLQMSGIAKDNEAGRDAEIVAKAAHLGLAPEASSLAPGTWIAQCPGKNHSLKLRPTRNLFYCGYCRVGGSVNRLEEFVNASAMPRT